MWASIARSIAAAENIRFRADQAQPVSGGCIHQSWRLADGDRVYFVKTNQAERAGMFVAEAAGLAMLARNALMRIPRPVCTGLADGQSFLALEWLDLDRRGRPAQLARALVAQHGISAELFGACDDNYIGDTPQPNAGSPDWAEFFAAHRLGWQLQLARTNGHHALADRGERLLERLPALIGRHAARPSLLHGDLWSGNYGFLADGSPVLFDPAVYYGDREADLAMTELFGGFPAEFHAAYREAWPLAPGYATRRGVYNLYHVLNHLNLFGASYAGQARHLVDQALAACA